MRFSDWLIDVPPSSAALAPTAGVAFAWAAAFTFLLIGAASLKLFDFRPAEARDPLWFTETRLPLPLSLLIAASEELLFRGYFQSAALVYLEPVYALFIVNLVFAACHYKGGLTFAMSAGFFGILASVMTLASASLAPAIVMHVSWNFLVWIARRREAARADADGDPAPAG